VFGIPGVHNIELYRGLEFARLRHVLVRHEQNAGFAADGYARVSGCAAAAFVISGPGVTNALTAVAQAYSDSVPLLVVASSPVRASLGKGWGVLHELDDQRAIAAGVAGLARSARGAPDVRDHLRAAFATLHAARARPAYLEIPLDLLGEPTTLRPERFARSGAAPPPSPAALAAAQALLAEAQRPLIIAGGGARRAGGALRKLVEALDGYLITTVAGKGAVAESHPASLGASLPYADPGAGGSRRRGGGRGHGVVRNRRVHHHAPGDERPPGAPRRRGPEAVGSVCGRRAGQGRCGREPRDAGRRESRALGLAHRGRRRRGLSRAHRCAV